jgi:isoquinoline 1-oxidoreductase alpha subunit
MISLTVNGRAVEMNDDGTTPLLWVLREELGLTGTKYDCGAALCGCCTVHVNGEARRSCVTPAR